MPESIHQVARKDNLCRLAPGLRKRGAPGAGKVRMHAWRRRRATPGGGCTQTEGTLFKRRSCTPLNTPRSTLRRPPEAAGPCPHGEAVYSHGRGIHDPSFGLLAVRTHDPGSEKPVKAEPMKDEIGNFELCEFLYAKPLAKESGTSGLWRYGQRAFDLKAAGLAAVPDRLLFRQPGYHPQDGAHEAGIGKQPEPCYANRHAARLAHRFHTGKANILRSPA